MKEELNLGKEKIGKLLLKFSIPCVISMLVASLYNIVDQIYIGHISGWDDAANQAVSVLCNGATNVVYPFTLIALAICLLFGDGAAALFSLSLGKKENDKANKSIGNGLVLQIISLVLLTAIGLIFKDQILNLFGATAGNMSYASKYYSIIILGFPFYMFGQGLNSSIRADGSPKYAMFATTIGAITNIILDPIFIFTLDMGIEGAAVATIIGQIITAILTFIYLFRSKLFKINRESIKLDGSIVKTISMLGISSLITQLAIVIIITVANNLINQINDPVYGVDIPLAVIGICMKVFGIVISICIGIALGGQPIIGYNFGAGKTERVKETYKKIIIACIGVGLIATILFQFFPDLIINLFGSGNGDVYVTFAHYCLRIFLGAILLTCIIKATSIFLQSCGASVKSMVVSVSRDVIIFVPAIVIIGLISQSVVTMLWAAVISDVVTAIIALLLVRSEFKKMDTCSGPIDENEIEYKSDSYQGKHIVVTISREYGSGGRYVGEMLAKKLGLNFYDKEIIKLAASESNLSESYIEGNEQVKRNIGGSDYNVDDKVFMAEKKVIKKIAKNESCVIVGRCADYILKDDKDVLKVFIYNDDEGKVNRACKYYGFDKKDALKKINKINKDREKHYNYYTDRKWRDFTNYDLILNSDSLGIEETANYICDVVKHK